MSLRNVEITIPHYYPDLLTLRLPLTGSREAHESFEFTHPFNQAILEHFTNIQAKCQSREVALTVGGLEHLSKQERSAETDRRYFDLLQIYMIKESNCSLNGRNARYCHVLLSSIFPTSETSQEFQEGVAVHLEEGWGWSRSAAILAQVIEHLRSRGTPENHPGLAFFVNEYNHHETHCGLSSRNAKHCDVLRSKILAGR